MRSPRARASASTKARTCCQRVVPGSSVSASFGVMAEPAPSAQSAAPAYGRGGPMRESPTSMNRRNSTTLVNNWRKLLTLSSSSPSTGLRGSG